MDLLDINMKKGVYLLIFASILLLSFVSAANLEINKTDLGSVVIAELNNPAVFNFTIDNYGPKDMYEIYSFLGATFSPRGTFELPAGVSTLEVKVYPDKEVRKNLGFYKFEYELRGQNSGIFKDFITIRIVELQNVISIDSMALLPSDKEATILLKNKENTNIENMKIHLTSDFFDVEKEVSFKPNEEILVPIEINKEKVSKLFAGKYVINGEINLDNAEAKISGILDYQEENSVSVDKYSSGVIARKTTITKTNKGNVATDAEIEVSKDIVSRLFSVYSIEPMVSDRNGLNVNYIWKKTLNPGESISINVTTNYTMPLILLILVVLVVVFAKVYSVQSVNISKRVSYVKTSNGQFALKVTLHVKASKHTDNIQVIDRLPEMTKLYEKFGRMPDRIDHATKRLFWNIPRLNSGEERVFSYIIYSGLNIVGRFELPSATAVYESEGKQMESISNKAYFAVDTSIRRDI